MPDIPIEANPYLLNLWLNLHNQFKVKKDFNLPKIELDSVIEVPVRILLLDDHEYYIDKDKYIYQKESVNMLETSNGSRKFDFNLGVRIGQFLKN